MTAHVNSPSQCCAFHRLGGSRLERCDDSLAPATVKRLVFASIRRNVRALETGTSACARQQWCTRQVGHIGACSPTMKGED